MRECWFFFVRFVQRSAYVECQAGVERVGAGRTTGRSPHWLRG
jgi:hypothetical protein